MVQKRKKVARKPAKRDIRTAVRRELDRIEKFLLRRGRNAGFLWDVLSALRGPDENDPNQEGKAFTIAVRRAAFPKLAVRDSDNIPAAFATFDGSLPNLSDVHSTLDAKFSDHFRRHIWQAEKALFYNNK